MADWTKTYYYPNVGQKRQFLIDRSRTIMITQRNETKSGLRIFFVKKWINRSPGLKIGADLLTELLKLGAKLGYSLVTFVERFIVFNPEHPASCDVLSR